MGVCYSENNKRKVNKKNDGKNSNSGSEKLIVDNSKMMNIKSPDNQNINNKINQEEKDKKIVQEEDKKIKHESINTHISEKKDEENYQIENTPPGQYIIPETTLINNKKTVQNPFISSSNKNIHDSQNKNLLKNSESLRKEKDKNKVPDLNLNINKMGDGINDDGKKNINSNNNDFIIGVGVNNHTPKENKDINKFQKDSNEMIKKSNILNIVDDKEYNYNSINNMKNNIIELNQSKSKNTNKKYEDFDLNKNYFLACPECKKCIPHIEAFDFDSNKKDFIIDYICPCNKSDNKIKKTYFIDLLVDYDHQNYCPNHKSKALSHYCSDCNYHICEQCKEEKHNCHSIENNINIISPENAKDLLEKANMKKDEFKGIGLINKIYEIYFIKIKENKEKDINKDSKVSVSRGYYNGYSVNENKNEKKQIQNEIKISNIHTSNNNNNNNYQENEKYNIIENKGGDNNENEFQKEEISENKISSDNNNDLNKLDLNNNYNINPTPINNINPGNDGSKNYHITNSSINNKDIDKNNNKNIKSINQNANNEINSDNNRKDFIITSSGNKNMKNDPNNKNIVNSNSLNNILSDDNINNNKKNIYNDSINQSKKDIKLKEYKNIHTLTGHTDKVVSLILLKSGHIATGSYDNTIKIWDIENAKCLLSLNENGFVFCLLEFEPNKILAGSSSNEINLWDLNNPKNNIYTFSNHTLWVNCLVKCDSNFFASCSNDTKIYIWDYYKKTCTTELSGHIDCILTLINLNDGKLCSGSADSTIKIWDWRKQHCVLELKPLGQWIKNIYQLNDGALLIATYEPTIKLYEDFKCVKLYKGHTKSVRAFCQIDENHFASGSFDNTIKIWDKKTCEIIQDLKGHTSNVICIIKLKDNTLVSCSTDKTIKIWK